MTLLYFILLIGVLIFVHELGHFLMAKLFKVKVLKFSLGFGPKAAGVQRGETEYVVAWLPLGGYVKMLGEDQSDEIAPQDRGRALHQKPLWQRYLIVFAGPAFNLIFPTVIYFFFYAADGKVTPAVVGKVLAGQPAAEAGLRPGDRVVAIDGDPIASWDEMQRTIAAHPQQTLRFTIERDGQTLKRTITPRAYVLRNRLRLQERQGRIGIASYFERVQIGISDPDSPAARAGLRTGDVITAVNGRSIQHWDDLGRVLATGRGEPIEIAYLRPGQTLSAFAELSLLEPHRAQVRPATADVEDHVAAIGIAPGEFFVHEVEPNSPAARIGIKPGDRVVSFDGRPLRHWEEIPMALASRREATFRITWSRFGGPRKSASFKQERLTSLDEYSQERERYVFGAHNRVLYYRADDIPVDNRWTYAISSAVRRTGEIAGVIAVALVQIFRGAIPRDTIGGPVMLYHTAGVAARKGWDRFLEMMALISINLGILNLLPIPILDGGHLMFYTIEAVKRRPLSLRAREIASYVGLFLLVSLMVFALKNDIVRYWFK